MPIGGFVISLDPPLQDEILNQFAQFPQIEVHGVNEDGNAVAVIDTETSDEMEQLTRDLQKIDGVLSLGVTYFHAEDEIEKIESGELKATFSFGRKGEKPENCS
ncbi:MAG: chaperone NapD [Thermodesulfobacteriota bacterium]|nr:chaperone NapD [Thermodesulfobacteriota bacterium]